MICRELETHTHTHTQTRTGGNNPLPGTIEKERDREGERESEREREKSSCRIEAQTTDRFPALQKKWRCSSHMRLGVVVGTALSAGTT